MADVVRLGELLIDFLATVSGTSLVEAPAFPMAPGGAPANGPPGLARLGAGLRIAADPDLRPALRPGVPPAPTDRHLAIRETRIGKLSDHELRFLTGTEDPGAARAQL